MSGATPKLREGTDTMEFSVKKYDLLEELEMTQGVVERKTTIPILSNLLFESAGNKLSLTATDLELSISTSCEAKIKKEGSGTIPAKKLLELVRLLPDEEIKFKFLENHWVQIQSGSARTRWSACPKKISRPSLKRHMSSENSREADVRPDFAHRILDFGRRIALHIEWRPAAREAGFGDDGSH